MNKQSKTSNKIQEAYKIKLENKYYYFPFNYTGMKNIQYLAYKLNIKIKSKYVKVDDSVKLIENINDIIYQAGEQGA